MTEVCPLPQSTTTPLRSGGVCRHPIPKARQRASSAANSARSAWQKRSSGPARLPGRAGTRRFGLLITPTRPYERPVQNGFP